MATRNGAANTVPSFITLNGPVREARFRFVDPPANTIRDGGVHDLFTITGRMDATGCNIGQPDFARFPGNVVFRIPTPVFGAGLIEAIKDSTILDNKNANLDLKRPLGITGHENREGNAGTISRLGWKAQNNSLAIFSGEAYNVEQGVSNEVFQQERDETPGCLFNATPESQTNFEETPPLRISSDVVNFTNFMRFLAPPSPVSSFPGAPEASIRAGRASFDSVGCALCHTPSLTTGVSTVSALSNKTANLFSDLLVHHMGTGLADDVIQGNAGPDEFRTAPLWGLGKRIFFLHDGRTNNLLNAIQAHSSTGSEANGSIDAFNRLTAGEKQNILNFLRSL